MAVQILFLLSPKEKIVQFLSHKYPQSKPQPPAGSAASPSLSPWGPGEQGAPCAWTPSGQHGAGPRHCVQSMLCNTPRNRTVCEQPHTALGKDDLRDSWCPGVLTLAHPEPHPTAAPGLQGAPPLSGHIPQGHGSPSFQCTSVLIIQWGDGRSWPKPTSPLRSFLLSLLLLIHNCIIFHDSSHYKPRLNAHK